MGDIRHTCNAVLGVIKCFTNQGILSLLGNREQSRTMRNTARASTSVEDSSTSCSWADIHVSEEEEEGEGEERDNDGAADVAD